MCINVNKKKQEKKGVIIWSSVLVRDELISQPFFQTRTNTKRPFLSKLIKKDGDSIELNTLGL